MSASIDFRGLTGLMGKVIEVQSGRLQKELVDNLHLSTREIRRDMEHRAGTRIQKRAMGSVEFHHVSNGMVIARGDGSSLGAKLFMGGEFGGQRGVHNRKRDMVVPVFGGPKLFIRRKATMQFLPHLGRRGYFYWPTIREWEPKLIKQSEDIVAKSLGGR